MTAGVALGAILGGGVGVEVVGTGEKAAAVGSVVEIVGIALTHQASC